MIVNKKYQAQRVVSAEELFNAILKDLIEVRKKVKELRELLERKLP